VSIVYDVTGEPMDYQMLPILYNFDEKGEITDHILMIAAQPDAEGNVVSRMLRLSYKQLNHLYSEQEFSNLLFRNGGVDALIRKEELLTGDIGKLAAYMLTSEEPVLDPETLDFENMEELDPIRMDLSQLWLEVRIDPVVYVETDDTDEMEKLVETEDIEREAWEISVWLCSAFDEVDVSSMLYSFNIGLNVEGLFDPTTRDQFLAESGVALVDEADQKALLGSELMQMPDVLPFNQEDVAEYYMIIMPMEDEEGVSLEYIEDVGLADFRQYVLAAPYAGPGLYMLAGIEEGF